MGYIDIRNFVDINIENKVVTQIDSTREAVVLFTLNTDLAPLDDSPKLYNIYTSMKQIDAIADIDKTKTAYKYAKTYFENGGIKLVVVNVNFGNTGSLYADLTAANVLPFVKELPNEYILVALDKVNNVAVAGTLATDYNTSTIDGKAVYGVKWKIFLSNMTYSDTSGVLPVPALDDTYANIENLFIKLIDSTADTASITNQVGAEMATAAYLNQIDFYGNETVQDYNFTVENVSTDRFDELDMDAYVKNAIQYHGNISVRLTDVVRNIGGDLSNGENLTNKFALIVCHQTLSQKVFNTLAQKLKGRDAIAALYATISQELNNYVYDGYLTLDKRWTHNSVKVTKKGVTYTLIEKGTPLVKGYYISILPYSTLTDAEILAHKAPDIYVYLADSYTIRKLTINGEVGGTI